MQLEITGLTRRFGEHVALADVTLAFEQAHTLVLIGPSGGGKTTLLRILAGLEIPDSGQVVLNGEPVRFDIGHRRRVGTVFQAFNLFPHLTALENITLPLEKVHGHTAASARELAMDLLRRFHLQNHAGKRPAEMSGGQRQRVAIVRAVAIKPTVMLFDEPTSALDPEMTAEVLELIEELRGEGRDLVLVTHQMGFARVVADRVAFLADGRVVETGTADELFRNPRTESCRRFLKTVLKFSDTAAR
jgi:polar amino acid transport system ATP-binding protein